MTPSGPTRARSLADDLRARPDDQVVALLLARPDLARPAPTDLTALAARSSTRASTQRALERLDTAHLQVLEALLATGSPADLDQAARWLGAEAGTPEGTAYERVVQELETQALVWRNGARRSVARTVAELLGPRPAGLWPGLTSVAGAVPATLATDARIQAVVDEAPPAARQVLDRLTWSSGALAVDGGTTTHPGVRWLLDRQLLVPWGEDQLVLPREVALVLRGGRVVEHPALLAPDVGATARSATVVDLVAGGAAGELLGLVDEVAALWGEQPPRVLRAGGLAVLDLRRLAATLDVEVARAAFVVELAHAAGLLADDGALDPSWAPTPAFDEWVARQPAVRWVELAEAWLAMTRAPHLVGTTVGRTTANALGPDVQWPPVRTLRHDLLIALASLPVGSACPPEGLLRLVRWHRPLLRVTDLADVLAALAQEAEWLGVTGRGALSAAGRALLQGGDVASAAAPHLPPAVTEVLLQADLTAVAPGRVEGAVAAFLRTAADVESRGGATVFRFSDDSVRRALDAGWTPEDLLARLASLSATPIPQPLAYLVQDVARRHGQVRVGAGASYVRSEDPVALDALLADPALATLQLRRLAPTVLVSPLTGDVVLRMLRERGMAPAAETSDGVVSVPGQAPRRTPVRRRPTTPVLTDVVDEEHARTLVASLRTGQATADALAASGELETDDPTVVLAMLRDAAADGQPLRVTYVGADGEPSRLLFHPRRVEGGRAYGTVGTSEVERVLSAHRIRSAALT